MFEWLTVYIAQSYAQSALAYSLTVLALVMSCAAGFGALSEVVARKLATRDADRRPAESRR
ncbi:hypothetical protein ACP3TJ_06815 [Desulforudis sp. 1088]|uniref:hypothetical protein n=1 Tax=unclassified Candidatus Desulforudis TaxID=2635950 RepID=UPI0034754893